MNNNNRNNKTAYMIIYNNIQNQQLQHDQEQQQQYLSWVVTELDLIQYDIFYGIVHWYFNVVTAALFFLFSLSSLISDIMENEDDKNDDAAEHTADTTTLNTHRLDSDIKYDEPHLHDVWQHEEKVDGCCQALR